MLWMLLKTICCIACFTCTACFSKMEVCHVFFIEMLALRWPDSRCLVIACFCVGDGDITPYCRSFVRLLSFEGHPLQARHKQNWGRGFILLLPQTAALPGSDAGSDVIKPALSFVIQNRQTACSMWCPMYGAHC